MMIRINRILYPTDFSDSSLHAAKYAQSFTSSYNAQLHALYVVEPYDLMIDVEGVVEEPTPADLLPGFQQRLADFCQEHLGGVQSVVTRAVSGRPFFEIIRYAKEQQIDLIVMGTHGRGILAHLLIGSVAEKVVRKAPCPVLTVRHPEHDFVMP